MRTMNGYIVSDRDIVANLDSGFLIKRVENGSVLYIHMVAKANRIDIATQDCIEPNGTTVADDSITDDGCIWGYKAILTNLRCKTAKGNKEHTPNYEL